MNRYNILMNEVRKRKPKTILEIGTWNGQHAKEMIEIAQLNTFDPDDITYFGFDLFQDFKEHKEEYCKKKPADINVVYKILTRTKANIHLRRGNTKDTLALYCPNIPIDFIFMDGGHSIETIASDWKNIKHLVEINPNIVVIFDDYYNDTDKVGCKKLILELIETGLYNIQTLYTDSFSSNPKSISLIKLTLCNLQ